MTSQGVKTDKIFTHFRKCLGREGQGMDPDLRMAGAGRWMAIPEPISCLGEHWQGSSAAVTWVAPRWTSNPACCFSAYLPGYVPTGPRVEGRVRPSPPLWQATAAASHQLLLPTTPRLHCLPVSTTSPSPPPLCSFCSDVSPSPPPHRLHYFSICLSSHDKVRCHAFCSKG